MRQNQAFAPRAALEYTLPGAWLVGSGRVDQRRDEL